MRQICPNCQKPIDVPESAAGGEFECPACGESFPVPKAYTPTVAPPPEEPAGLTYPAAYTPAAPVDRPAPPPGYVPTPPPTVPAAEVGEPRSRGVTLTPGVVGWVPVVCLTLCLVLSFFPWVGAYPGGYRVFSQNPWEAGIGSVSIPAIAVPQTLQEAEPELRTHAPPNLFMLLYGVLLVLTVILAWVERVVTTEPNVQTIPGPLAWLPGVWPYRFALLIGLAGLLLFLVAFQMWRGFGLETIVERYAASRHTDAPTGTAAAQQIAEIQIGMEAAKFAVQRTTILCLVVAAHVLAVLGLLTRIWLSRRGTKPPPRLVMQY